MNDRQIRHTKAMARKISMYATTMASHAKSLELEDHLDEFTIEDVERKFAELEHWWNEIQSILHDMLPELKNQ